MLKIIKLILLIISFLWLIFAVLQYFSHHQFYFLLLAQLNFATPVVIGIFVIYLAIIGLLRIKKSSPLEFSIAQLVGIFFVILTLVFALSVLFSGRVGLDVFSATAGFWGRLMGPMGFLILLIGLWWGIGNLIQNLKFKINYLCEIGIGMVLFTLILWILGQFNLLNREAVWAVIFVLGFAVITLNWHAYLKLFNQKFQFKLLSWSSFIFLLFLILIALNIIDNVRPFPLGWDDLNYYAFYPRQIAAQGSVSIGISNFFFVLSSVGYIIFGDGMFSLLLGMLGGVASALAIYQIVKNIIPEIGESVSQRNSSQWNSKKERINNNNKTIGQPNNKQSATFLQTTDYRLQTNNLLPLLALLIFYTIPIVQHISFVEVKPDLWAVFFVFLGVESLVIPAKAGILNFSSKWGNYFLAGAFLAFAFFIKPTALFMILAAVVMLGFLRLGKAGALFSFFLTIAVALEVYVNQGMDDLRILVGGGQILTSMTQLAGITGLAGLITTLVIKIIKNKGELFRRVVQEVLPFIMFGIGFVSISSPWLYKQIIINNNYSFSAFAPENSPQAQTLDLRAVQADASACVATGQVEDVKRYFGNRVNWWSYLTVFYRTTVMPLSPRGNVDPGFVFLALLPLSIWTILSSRFSVVSYQSLVNRLSVNRSQQKTENRSTDKLNSENPRLQTPGASATGGQGQPRTDNRENSNHSHKTIEPYSHILLLLSWFFWSFMGSGILWYNLAGFLPLITLIILSLRGASVASDAAIPSEMQNVKCTQIPTPHANDVGSENLTTSHRAIEPYSHNPHSSLVKYIILTLVGLQIFFSALYRLSQFGHPSVMRYGAGQYNAEQFITEVGNTYYEVYTYLNQHPQGKIYKVGTFIKYFLNHAKNRVIDDFTLDTFNCAVNFKSAGGTYVHTGCVKTNLENSQKLRFYRALNKNNVRFIVYDLRLSTLEADKCGTLHQKEDLFGQWFKWAAENKYLKILSVDEKTGLALFEVN